MKTLVITSALILAVALPAQAEQRQTDPTQRAPFTPANWKHYNANPDFQPMTLPNGIVANTSSAMRSAAISRAGGAVRAIPVTEGTWILGGHGYGSTVFETEEGLVVISTGASAADGREFRRVIREQISSKPVIALIYDHIHGARGAKTLLDGDTPPIIAHPDHNRIGEASGGLANPNIPELGPHMDARGELQFGAHLPTTGADAPLTGRLDLAKENAWIPATSTVEHGETRIVGGIEMQFFHAITDTEESLTIWLPQRKIVVDNAVWPVINMYTLRGDRYRDPRNWIAALRQIRDLQPEIILTVGAGAAPLVGKEACLDAVSTMMDLMAFIYDQSLRLASQGVNSSEIRHHVEIPASILRNAYANEVYGQFDTFPQAQPVYNHGWYSGYAEDLHTLPRSVRADYLLRLAGGAEAVLAAYREAMDNAEYLWAKELAAQLYYADPGSDQYRQALADVFRRLGQMSPGSAARNFYLSAALSLEGNTDISLTGVRPAEWIMQNPLRAVEQLRIRINPERAAGKEGVLRFEIDGQVAALHVRNSVAEFVPEPEQHYRKPDGGIKLSGEHFAAYYRGEMSVERLVSQSSASGRARELLELFDAYERVPMYPSSHRGLSH